MNPRAEKMHHLFVNGFFFNPFLDESSAISWLETFNKKFNLTSINTTYTDDWVFCLLDNGHISLLTIDEHDSKELRFEMSSTEKINVDEVIKVLEETLYVVEPSYLLLDKRNLFTIEKAYGIIINKNSWFSVHG